MSKVVYRYEVPGTHLVPVGSKVVHFAFQPARNSFSVWMLVPAGKEWDVESRGFEVVATGQPFVKEGEYRSTTTMPDDFHIFHLIEVTS